MKTYLETEEVNRMVAAATNLRDRLLVRLLFHLGCRVSEVLALEVEDIDLKEGTVTILHLKTRLRLTCPACNTRLGRKHAFCPTCGSKIEGTLARQQECRRRRVLPIDIVTKDMLKQYVSRGGLVKRNGKKLIFGINRHRAWQIIRDCARKAGLPMLTNPETGKVHGVSPHRLRDAFAVHAMKLDDSGDGLRLLQEHLGHASFATTARYRKVSGEEHRKWFDRLWEDSSG